MTNITQKEVLDTIDALRIKLNKMLENGLDVNNEELLRLSEELDVWINKVQWSQKD